MENTKSCPNCKKGNAADAKFCMSCGANISNEPVETASNYSDLKYVIQKIIDRKLACVNINIKDYWVAFCSSALKYNEFVVSASGNKDYEFKQLGFIKESNINNAYYKIFMIGSISANQIIQEIKTIFETIHNVNFLTYEIEEVEADILEYPQNAENKHNEVDNINLGHQHYNAKNYSEAAKCYLMTANKGDAVAQNYLGHTYYSMQNYSEAIKWYRLSAKQGNAEAQGSLGNMYHSGLGVAKNYDEAKKWYQMAAQQGNAYSQNGLGVLCHDIQNYIEAEKWYQMAAQQGNTEAIKNLQILKNQINNNQRIEQKVYQDYQSEVRNTYTFKADSFSSGNLLVQDSIEIDDMNVVCRKAGGPTVVARNNIAGVSIEPKTFFVNVVIETKGGQRIVLTGFKRVDADEIVRLLTGANTQKGGCYIATACYGSYDCTQVLTFRNFRDEYLSQTITGRMFIKTYYALSPAFAEWLKNKHKVNTFIREKFLDKIYNCLKEKYKGSD